MLHRRAFLSAIAASLFANASSIPWARADPLATQQFLSACKTPQGQYAAALFSSTGKILQLQNLPGRSHDIAWCPKSRRAVAFARRPGTFAVAFQIEAKTQPVFIDAAPGRHFYGHGTFTPDGRLLYATENDFEAARGIIGIYDVADNFQRLGEFDTHGVGPHEVLLSSDGKTLIIANGGIETHPDFGRAKLNLADMAPNVVFLNAATGDLLEKHALPGNYHQLSIRHMDMDQTGRVWFGGQYEGPSQDASPLIGQVTRGRGVTLMDMPADELHGLRHYIGSVAANKIGDQIAISSPRGNTVMIFDLAGKKLASIPLQDGCGLAASGDGFMATSGEGMIASLSKPNTDAITTPYRWDNHLLAIGNL